MVKVNYFAFGMYRNAQDRGRSGGLQSGLSCSTCPLSHELTFLIFILLYSAGRGIWYTSIHVPQFGICLLVYDIPRRSLQVIVKKFEFVTELVI